MEQLLKLGIVALSVLYMAACTDDEPKVNPIVAGDYPSLERDPNVNVWGAGIDFIHAETKLTETTFDYKYLSETDTYTFDAKFCTVKAYYTTSAGETISEGCPAVLNLAYYQTYRIPSAFPHPKPELSPRKSHIGRTSILKRMGAPNFLKSYSNPIWPPNATFT